MSLYAIITTVSFPREGELFLTYNIYNEVDDSLLVEKEMFTVQLPEEGTRAERTAYVLDVINSTITSKLNKIERMSVQKDTVVSYLTGRRYPPIP